MLIAGFMVFGLVHYLAIPSVGFKVFVVCMLNSAIPLAGFKVLCREYVDFSGTYCGFEGSYL